MRQSVRARRCECRSRPIVERGIASGCSRYAFVRDAFDRSQAFMYCSALVFISIPESVVHISMAVFYNCKSLTALAFPPRITSLKYAAVMHCEASALIAEREPAVPCCLC